MVSRPTIKPCPCKALNKNRNVGGCSNWAEVWGWREEVFPRGSSVWGGSAGGGGRGPRPRRPLLPPAGRAALCAAAPSAPRPAFHSLCFVYLSEKHRETPSPAVPPGSCSLARHPAHTSAGARGSGVPPALWGVGASC